MTSATASKLVALASLAGALLLPLPAGAADLPNWGGGSMKDSFGPAVQPSAGPCYLRGDVGYSWSSDPEVNWLVTRNNNFLTDDVTNVSMDGSWLVEGGAGCGSGSRGLRGEVAVGWRGDRDLSGEPGFWVPPGGVAGIDPLHTSVESVTLMFNGYYDLGNFRGFVPYVGAGLGVSWNTTDETYFTGNPFLTNRIRGETETSFAWALMAGVGYQISPRAIIDLGYRYIDLGEATSGTIDSAGFVNPPVRIDDLTAHEIKLGLRYHFGGSRMPAYPEPLK